MMILLLQRMITYSMLGDHNWQLVGKLYSADSSPPKLHDIFPPLKHPPHLRGVPKSLSSRWNRLWVCGTTLPNNGMTPM